MATTADLTNPFPPGLVVAPTANALTTCGGSPAVTAAPGSGSATLGSGASIPANGTCTLAVDVTTATGSTYVNTIPAGAVQSANGSSPLVASATVQFSGGPPTYRTAFEAAEDFATGNVNGPQGCYASTASYWMVATANPNAGTQELRTTAAAVGTGTTLALTLFVAGSTTRKSKSNGWLGGPVTTSPLRSVGDDRRPVLATF